MKKRIFGHQPSSAKRILFLQDLVNLNSGQRLALIQQQYCRPGILGSFSLCLSHGWKGHFLKNIRRVMEQRDVYFLHSMLTYSDFSKE